MDIIVKNSEKLRFGIIDLAEISECNKLENNLSVPVTLDEQSVLSQSIEINYA